MAIILFIILLARFVYQIIDLMSKLILTKFKKSLAESSNIISDSRILSYTHRDINMQEGLEATPEVERQYIDKSSLVNTYRNTPDHNKLIKKIPQLISENDELKQKIRKMQQQLALLVQAQKKRSSFSFRHQNMKEDEHNVQINTHRLRKPEIEEVSSQKDSRYSLDCFNYQQNKQSKRKQSVHSRFYKQRTSKNYQDMHAMIEKLNKLQDIIEQLKQQNKRLKQQNTKLYCIKKEKANQIDTIMNKFEQTLKNQQNFSKIEVSLLQQKLSKLKKQLQTYQKQKITALQQNQKLKRLIQSHIHQQNLLNQLHQAKLNQEIIMNKNRQKGLYKLNETVQHLWSVKDAEFANLLTTLRFLNPKMQ